MPKSFPTHFGELLPPQADRLQPGSIVPAQQLAEAKNKDVHG